MKKTIYNVMGRQENPVNTHCKKFEIILFLSLFLLILSLYGSPVYGDSLLTQGEGLDNLYGTEKAGKVGDVLTVKFDEKTVSQQKAKGKLKSTYNTGVNQGRGLLDFFLGGGMSGGEEQDVETTTRQEHSLDSTMSVRIIEILPNNQARILGEKSMEVNHETQKLTLEGIIRLADITPGNTIKSSQIADLKAKVNGLPVNRSVKQRKGGVIRWIWNLVF